MLIRKYAILFLLISSILGITFSTGVAAAGTRSRVPAPISENLDLVANVGGALGRMVVDHNPGFYNLAYVAVGPRIKVLDLSGDRAAVLWQSKILDGVVGRIVVQNNMAYVAAGSKLYLYSIEITYNPLRVTLIRAGSYLTDWSVASQPPFILTDFVVKGSYVYALLSRGTIFGVGKYYLDIIDVSNPATPTLTGELNNNGPADAIALSGDRVYIAGNTNLTVIDVSDPATPNERGQCSNCLSAPSDIVIDGNRAYVLNFSSPKLRIFSLTNPDQPVLAHSYKDSTHGAITGICIDDPYIYLSFSAGGLRVLDMSASPIVEVGYYDYFNDFHGNHLAGSGVAIDDNTVYLNEGAYRLHKIDISRPNRKLDGNVIADFALAAPVSVKVSQDYVYAADRVAGFYIVQTNTKNNPQVIGWWPSGNPLVDLDIQGDYAYLISDFNLYIIDISTPTAPRLVGSYEDASGGFSRVTAAGNYAYVMAEGRGLMTFNISNPANPAPVSATMFKFSGRPFSLSAAYIRGTTLYATSDYDFCRVDIARPASPILKNAVDLAGYARDVTLSARPNEIEYAYVVTEGELDRWGDYSNGGLRILNLSDLSEIGYLPTNPLTKRVAKQVAADKYTGYIIESEDVGSRTLPCSINTLRMIDLHDFRNMSVDGYFKLPYEPGLFSAADDYVYVPVAGYGLMLLHPIPHAHQTLAARAGGSLVSAFDNTTYTFAPETFTGITRITHSFLVGNKLPPTGNLSPIQHAAQVKAVDLTSGQNVEPAQTYTITVHYTDKELGAVKEETLAFYFWNGSQWSKEPSSLVDIATNTVTSSPNHFSQWAVLGEKPQLTQKLYYPHVATINTWETEICVINTSNAQSLHGVFTAYNDAGTVISTLDNITLPPNGRRAITVGSKFPSPDQIGYIIFAADADTFVGYTKFYVAGQYRVAIPALAEINTGDMLISHIASTKDWWTGISLLNTTASKETVTVNFNNGVTKSKIIGAGEHIVFRIRDLIDGRNGRPHPEIASAVIGNAAGIVGLELFGNQNQLSGILLKDDTATALYFPHLASSDGWWTGIAAYNPHPDSHTLHITPYSVDGKVLKAQTYALGGHKKYLGAVSGLGLPGDAAWFKIESDAGITGLELFGTADSNLLAGYTGVNITARKAVFPKLEKAGWTGIAFANITSEPADINLIFYNDAGVIVARGRAQVGPYSKASGIAASFSPEDISGATYIAYSSKHDIVGFQLNGSNDGMMLDALPGM